jgi:hypothetical protein
VDTLYTLVYMSIGFGILAIGALAAAALYLLPTIIVLARRAGDLAGPMIVLNVFLGWTLLGWVASLAMSVASSTTPRPPRCPTQPTLPPTSAANPDALSA